MLRHVVRLAVAGDESIKDLTEMKNPGFEFSRFVLTDSLVAPNTVKQGNSNNTRGVWLDLAPPTLQI